MREHVYALGSSAQDVNVKKCTHFETEYVFKMQTRLAEKVAKLLQTQAQPKRVKI